VATAWGLGIAYGRELSPTVPPQALWLIALALFPLILWLFLKKRVYWLVALFTLLVILSALTYAQTRLPFERLYSLTPQLTTVRGLVVSYPAERPDRTSFTLQPEGLLGFLQIFYRHPYGSARDVAYGDVVVLSARFEIPWVFEDFNYREYLRTRGIWAVGALWSVRDLGVLKSNQGHPLLQWGYAVRQKFFAFLDRYVPREASALLKGLLFGERAYLSEDVEQSFRDAGVMHVLAVSGLHLGILLGLFWWIFRKAGLSVTLTYVLLIPLVLLYLALVGFKVSLVRAALMFAFVALGYVLAEQELILKRWIDPLQGLSAAALVIVAFTPQALFDVSFQLSFAATAGILITLQWAHPRLQALSARLKERWQGDRSLPRRIGFWLGDRLAYLFVISAAAQLAVAPVLATHFHRAYLITLLANLIVVPMVTVALWLGVPLLLTAAMGLTPLALLLGAFEGIWLAGLTSTVALFARVPGAYVNISAEVLRTAWVSLPIVFSALWLGELHLAAINSLISRTKASASWVKRSIARLATLRGKSSRRL
jgi:competence protein ComEC